ncbi:MAG: hypothetical protein ACREHG_08855, partial [Candidatus Saccharimonadales bacterium]
FALIFNDIRDLYFAYLLVEDCKPSGALQYNRQWGHYWGLNFRIIRLIMGTLHELLNMIDEQQDNLNHPFFRDVEMALPVNIRDDWREVVNVACGDSSQKLSKVLLKIRNNATFLYSPKAIEKGFKKHFLSSKGKDTRAYLSRGERDTMQGWRFYFSDAAIGGLGHDIAGSASDALGTEFQKLLDRVSLPLSSIVTSFIQKRGFAFRPERTS